MLNWKIWRGPCGGENGFRTQLKDNLYPTEDTVKVVCRCRVVSVRDKDLLTGAGHITLLLEVVTRPRSIWCSVTSALSPTRPDQGGFDGRGQPTASPMLTAIMSGGVGISGRQLSTQLINSLEKANHSFS